MSRVIHPPHPVPKVRYDVNARRTGPSAGNKATAGPEGEFPCKKCGRSVSDGWSAGCSCEQAGGHQMLCLNSRRAVPLPAYRGECCAWLGEIAAHPQALATASVS